ncbi:MAG: hypothetical protein LPK14_15380, partial [Hymenobacteraceae bacterium]|nr:hypothetical protein [Hymenobacteraceae bacterium]
MSKYKIYVTAVLLASAGVGCTSLSEGQENLPVGAEVNPRVRYRSPANTGIRERMDEQASEINRKRNIEQFDQNKAAMTPPDLRPRQLPFSPIDSTRHNIYWPIR